jgi:hypothetical protein
MEAKLEFYGERIKLDANVRGETSNKCEKKYSSYRKKNYNLYAAKVM